VAGAIAFANDRILVGGGTSVAAFDPGTLTPIVAPTPEVPVTESHPVLSTLPMPSAPVATATMSERSSPNLISIVDQKRVEDVLDLEVHDRLTV
jgi:hypothetical protein